MVSHNGGSWTDLDPKKNNVIAAFKFSGQELIICELDLDA